MESLTRRTFVKLGAGSAITLAGGFFHANAESSAPASPLRIAIISDVHVHNIYGNYDFDGLPDAQTGKKLTIRTLKDSVNSTRIFNEPYFALLAALDELAKQQVKYVVLSGDYSDDGQQPTVEGIAAILTQYEQRHGMRFFATPGNHDVNRPQGDDSWQRMLNADGTSTMLSSKPGVKLGDAQSLIVTAKMQALGYEHGLPLMKPFGFFKRDDFLHWETPFGDSDELSKRQYLARSPDGSKQWNIVDASYLVEPEAGLWLLSIDANVYQVKDGPEKREGIEGYSTSSNTGWNALLTEKPFMLPWVKSVVQRAKAQNKKLLVFSHYPLVDFLDGTVEDEKQLFGSNSFIKRTPRPEVAEQALAAGIRLHFSGHLHVNDTGVYRGSQGTLVNVAVPSLAAYPPAMKLATLHSDRVDIDTLVLRNVPQFNHLFPFYQKELDRTGEPLGDILKSRDYYDFLHHHLALLVRQRFLVKDWPEDLSPLINTLNCGDLLWIAQQQEPLSAKTLPDAAERKPNAVAGTDGLQDISLLTLVTDWYCLRNGSDLAWQDIPAARVKQYRALLAAYTPTATLPPDSLQYRFGLMLKILAGYINDEPATRFVVDMQGNFVTV
ncbi:metallophosphoesterase [Pectobacterium sp. 21LCBS03]|uniref:metallophosphoesterase n=1 Tax=Pectobacterium sp. 21LCBS03 TaxID=2935858 RepID=UPI00200CD096|nr:metallophosphoesterase [Pectobacterium sp. 21LCBS03]UPY95807.1 metallophosphoesterase [Pectobacterium sp. 21LCBS03]